MTITNVGLIGYGSIARTHQLALAQIGTARLTAATGSRKHDQNPPAGLTWCASVEELLATDVDLVGICSPSMVHAEQVRLALDAGKHVVVEKPPAASAAQLEELATIASNRGLQLSIVSQQRFLPHPRHAVNALASRRLGRLILGEVRLHWRRPQSYYDQAPWRATDPQGGSLANQGWHAVDLLTAFCGPAAAVAGQTATLAHDIRVEDTAVAAIRFANDALGTIVTTTGAHDGEPSVLELITDRAHIQFTDAVITRWDVPDDVPPPPPTGSRGGGGSNDPTAIEFEPHRLQWLDMINAIQTGRPLTVKPSDAVATLALIEACYTSSCTESVVTMNTATQVDA